MNKLLLFSVVILIQNSTVQAATLNTCQIRGDAPAKVGKSLIRFEQVNQNIYRGSRPNKDEDYAYLKSLGIKTIVSLEILEMHKHQVRSNSEKFGLKFISAPVEGSFVAPSDESVNAALEAMRDPENYPIYLHCALGRDRTSLLVALYRVFDESCTVKDARAEMREYGLTEGSATLSGLNRYFDRHVKGVDDSEGPK